MADLNALGRSDQIKSADDWFDLNATIAQPDNELLWSVAAGDPTIDGTHPNGVGDNAMAANGRTLTNDCATLI